MAKKFITNKRITSIDTIGLKLFIESSNLTGEYYQDTVMENIKTSLERLPYCRNVKRVTEKDNGRPTEEINLILSYPSAIYGNNSNLVDNPEDSLRAQKIFVRKITQNIESNGEIDRKQKNWILKHLRIRIIRVEYPFTFSFSDGSFSYQENLLNILRKIYIERNPNSKPKKIKCDEEGIEKLETLFLGETTNYRRGNKNIVIYNQEAKFEDLYGNRPSFIKEIKEKNEDLGNRVRIEVSIRTAKHFTLKTFKKSDIYTHYSKIALEYLMNNLLNERVFIQICNRNQEILEMKLQKACVYYRASEFVLENRNIIYDYEILRKAIMNVDSSKNTAYWRCSTMKENIQRFSNVDYFHVIDKFREMLKMCNREYKKFKKREDKNGK